MRAIKHKNTKPELQVRKILHSMGYRYRLHVRNLPGKPDLVLRKYSAAIFVHGCFFHGHNCHLFKLPQTRTEFWRDKIEANIARDIVQIDQLKMQGWRVAVVWECAFKGGMRLDLSTIATALDQFLQGDVVHLQIQGGH